MELSLVLCISPKGFADQIVHDILSRRVAFCIDAVQKNIGFYGWQNNLIANDEVILLITAIEEFTEDITKIILESHPYKMPIIVSVDCDAIHPKYVKWLEKNLESGSE